jgi:hypothetical protein
MQVKSEILEALDDYHYKSLRMQRYFLDKQTRGLSLEEIELE